MILIIKNFLAGKKYLTLYLITPKVEDRPEMFHPSLLSVEEFLGSSNRDKHEETESSQGRGIYQLKLHISS